MSKAYEVELRDPLALKPYPKNPKKHSAAQIATLKGLILANGWTQLVVVDTDDEIIIGHGRTLAACEIAAERPGYQIPVAVFRGTKLEAQALRLSDNQVTSKDYDLSLLQGEISDLVLQGVDALDLGYSANEVAFLNEPLDVMDPAVFVDDVQAAVEEQRERNTAAEATIDAATAPLADAFGFRRLTVQQSRRVRAFQTQIEGETGKTGAEALMVFLDNMGVAA